ncbi:MAG TPA: 30S ribosomal protein S2 [Patescibacteria group bacterium]|nr:30S ribosomal protein S2 [Patescibacteria group bacterium]
MTIDISLEELVKTGAHFGHQVKRWNPRMEKFIHSSQNGVHIFDLIKTKECLGEALDVLRKSANEGKTIVLLGTKKQIKDKIKSVAEDAGVSYVNERWLGGTITNFEQVKKSSDKLEKLSKGLASGEYDTYTKKEKLLMEREIQRLERFFGGIKNMTKVPDLVFIIDIRKERGAVREASVKGVETIGIVDTNSDPNLVDYPIPMNDDAKKAIEYVLDLVSAAIKEGKKGDIKEKSDIVKKAVKKDVVEKVVLKKAKTPSKRKPAKTNTKVKTKKTKSK